MNYFTTTSEKVGAYEVDFVRKQFHSLKIDAVSPDDALNFVHQKLIEKDQDFINSTIEDSDPYYSESEEIRVHKDGVLVAISRCHLENDEKDGILVPLNLELAHLLLKMIEGRIGQPDLQEEPLPYVHCEFFKPTDDTRIAYNRIKSAVQNNTVGYKEEVQRHHEEMQDFLDEIIFG